MLISCPVLSVFCTFIFFDSFSDYSVRYFAEAHQHGFIPMMVLGGPTREGLVAWSFLYGMVVRSLCQADTAAPLTSSGWSASTRPDGCGQGHLPAPSVPDLGGLRRCRSFLLIRLGKGRNRLGE